MQYDIFIRSAHMLNKMFVATNQRDIIFAFNNTKPFSDAEYEFICFANSGYILDLHE